MNAIIPEEKIKEFAIENFHRIDWKYVCAVRLATIIVTLSDRISNQNAAKILAGITTIVDADPKMMAEDIKKFLDFLMADISSNS